MEKKGEIGYNMENITQEEINRLLEVIKIEQNEAKIIFTCERKKEYFLKNEIENRELFRLVFITNKNPRKKTMTILKDNFILKRIDINGWHKNPDYLTGIPLLDKYSGQFIEETHVHFSLADIEKEDSWAVPLYEVFSEKSIEKILDFFGKTTGIKEKILYEPEIENLKLF